MSEGMDTPRLTSNGSGTVASPDAPERSLDNPRSFSDQSIEERLNALMETVRTWDWRAAPERSRPLLAREPAQPAVADTTRRLEVAPRELVEVPGAPALPEIPADHEPRIYAPTTLDKTQVVPVVRAASTRPLVDAPQESGVAPLHDIFVTQPLPTDVAQPRTEVQFRRLSPLLESEPHPEFVAVSGPPHGGPIGPLRRAWSHRTTKMAVLCVVAVVAVFAIIWGIRMANKNPGSDTPSPTTATQPASKQPTHTAFVLPITTAQLAQYKQYAQGVQNANAAATKVLVSSGNSPTAAQLTAPVATYRTAVNLYDFDLRFIQWPPSMAAAIAADHTQLEVLVNFLQTFSTAGTSNITGWLSGLHIRGGAAQTTDNQVRQDLGLPALSSFP
jgi:hypothetical protein